MVESAGGQTSDEVVDGLLMKLVEQVARDATRTSGLLVARAEARMVDLREQDRR